MHDSDVEYLNFHEFHYSNVNSKNFMIFIILALNKNMIFHDFQNYGVEFYEFHDFRDYDAE